MIRFGVRITEVATGNMEIIKERGQSNNPTKAERVLAAAIEDALTKRINMIMTSAKECGAETSREVRHG